MKTITGPTERPFSVGEYYQLADAGILQATDRVELVNGRIYLMPPIGTGHAECVRRVTDLLYERVARRARISVQNPIRLDDRSEPEPDMALLDTAGSYAGRHPAGKRSISTCTRRRRCTDAPASARSGWSTSARVVRTSSASPGKAGMPGSESYTAATRCRSGRSRTRPTSRWKTCWVADTRVPAPVSRSQKWTLRPSCATRGSRAEVIDPKPGVPSTALGSPRCQL